MTIATVKITAGLDHFTIVRINVLSLVDIVVTDSLHDMSVSA